MIEIVKNRKSTREFTEEKVKKEDILEILKATINVASSRNVQPLTYLVFTEKEKIEKMAEFSGNQKQVKNAPVFILILADIFKLKEALNLDDVKINQNIFQEVLVDAGIVISTIDLLSQSMGYGSTIIGGIGSVNPKEVIKYLNLPKYVVPIVGITMGIPLKKEVLKKPKQSFETLVFFDEEYDEKRVIDGVLKYNDELNKYWEKINVNLPSHLQVIETYLRGSKKSIYQEAIIDQGFENE